MILEIYGKLLVKMNKYILKISDKSAIIRPTRIEKGGKILGLEFKKYDVVMTNFPKNCGSVQAGHRPAIIIQNDIGNQYSPTLLVIPLTTKIKSLNQPTHMLIRKTIENGLSQDSMLLAEQPMPVCKEGIKKIGEIRNEATKKQILACFLNEALYGDTDAPAIRMKGGRVVCTA